VAVILNSLSRMCSLDVPAATPFLTSICHPAYLAGLLPQDMAMTLSALSRLAPAFEAPQDFVIGRSFDGERVAWLNHTLPYRKLACCRERLVMHIEVTWCCIQDMAMTLSALSRLAPAFEAPQDFVIGG
jgi:hypothetical protein